MKAYFVTQKNMGKCVVLKPRKPETAPDYEGPEQRICVSSSILGALSSIGRNLGLGCYTYVYMCKLDESEIIQPNTVNDVDMTGEMWILNETGFVLHKIIKLNSVNSFCIDTEKDTEIYNFEFEIVQ